MLLEKKALSLEEIEAQTALELPDRELMALVTVNLLNGAVIQVPVGIAANLCDINAAVLIAQINDFGEAECDATTDVDADGRGGNGNGYGHYR